MLVISVQILCRSVQPTLPYSFVTFRWQIGGCESAANNVEGLGRGWLGCRSVFACRDVLGGTDASQGSPPGRGPQTPPPNEAEGRMHTTGHPPTWVLQTVISRRLIRESYSDATELGDWPA
jgi:hypothetical protein